MNPDSDRDGFSDGDEINVYHTDPTSGESNPSARPTEDKSLIAYYPFNGNGYDASGNHNDANVYGAALATDRFGQVGMAYRFDSAKLNAIVTDIPNLPVGKSARTISLWYRMDPTAVGDRRFFGYGKVLSSSTAAGSTFSLSLTPSGMFGLKTTGGGYFYDSPVNKYADSKWHQMIVTFADNWVSAYFDGDNVTWSEVPPYGLTVDTSNSSFSIGYFAGGYFDGDMDDVRIYNRALSSQEVEELFTIESPNTIGSTVRFDSFAIDEDALEMVFPSAIGGSYRIDTTTDFHTWAIGASIVASSTRTFLRVLQTLALGFSLSEIRLSGCKTCNCISSFWD